MIVEKLLEVDQDTHQARPTAYARTINVFLDIITRDRGSDGDSQGRKKRKASKEFAYIYYMCDVTSPYYHRPEDQRKQLVAETVFDDPSWEPDELVIKGMKVYRKAHETIAVQLLSAAHQGAHKIKDYLIDIDLTAEDKNNKPKHSVKDLIKAMQEIGSVIKSLENLEERVQKEQMEETKTRGDVEETPFNS